MQTKLHFLSVWRHRILKFLSPYYTLFKILGSSLYQKVIVCLGAEVFGSLVGAVGFLLLIPATQAVLGSAKQSLLPEMFSQISQLPILIVVLAPIFLISISVYLRMLSGNMGIDLARKGAETITFRLILKLPQEFSFDDNYSIFSHLVKSASLKAGKAFRFIIRSTGNMLRVLVFLAFILYYVSGTLWIILLVFAVLLIISLLFVARLIQKVIQRTSDQLINDDADQYSYGINTLAEDLTQDRKKNRVRKLVGKLYNSSESSFSSKISTSFETKKTKKRAPAVIELVFPLAIAALFLLSPGVQFSEGSIVAVIPLLLLLRGVILGLTGIASNLVMLGRLYNSTAVCTDILVSDYSLQELVLLVPRGGSSDDDDEDE